MSLVLLKILACVFMLLDHIGYVFGLMPLKIIGRLAFPIFAFLISNGFIHTKNVKKYILRLFVFALISEIPFNLFMSRKVFYPQKQNVMFTLLLGLLAIVSADYLKKHNKFWLFIFPLAFFGITALYLRTDYGYIGVATVFVFYLFKDNKILSALAFAFVSCWDIISYGLYSIMPFLGNIPIIIRETPPKKSQFIQLFRILAVIPISMYNGEYGIDKSNVRLNNAVKYGFYLFYPVHMLILYFIGILCL